MAKKNWLTGFTGSNPVQDPDPVTDVMPDLDDVSAPGAADGDDALSSHVETLRDKLDTLCKIVGDSLKLPAGAICDILDRDHSGGDAQWVRVGERTTAPTGVAGKVYFYALDDGGTSKAYVKLSDDTQIEIGSGGGQTNTVAGATGITNTGDNVDAVLAPTYGSSANTICEGDDARLSDARTPTGAASGDLAGTYPGPTVTTGAIDNTKLADMAQATIKGRASGAGTGDPVDLTSAQATAILDTFTSALKGLAPASGGGTTNFLRADGTWAAPAGGGGFSAYEEEFTASAGANEFTLSTTPAVNANTESGRNILGVFRNGVRSRYLSSITLANEYNQSGGTDKINVVGQSGGEIFVVVFGV